MTEAPPRPVPAVDETSRAFWTGGAEGRLLISSCTDCRRLFHPPMPCCPYCAGRVIEPVEVSGTGVVDAATVVHRPWIPGYETPYVVARIRLDDHPDVLLVSNVVDCDPGEVHRGLAVEVVFEPRGDVHVPVFRPRR